MRNVLITGGAGFIGSHLVARLLSEGDWRVSVVDDFNDFYDPSVKRRNVEPYAGRDDFRLHEADIRDRSALEEIFGATQFDALSGKPPFDASRFHRSRGVTLNTLRYSAVDWRFMP